jgi:hypothetical protein
VNNYAWKPLSRPATKGLVNLAEIIIDLCSNNFGFECGGLVSRFTTGMANILSAGFNHLWYDKKIAFTKVALKTYATSDQT